MQSLINYSEMALLSLNITRVLSLEVNLFKERSS